MGNKQARADKKETAGQGVEQNLQREQKESLPSKEIRTLAKKTPFTTKEVSDLFKIFKSLAAQTPSQPDVILKSQFQGALEEAGINVKDNTRLIGLFTAFDKNESGTINFREYVLGMSACSKGTAREKISLSFQVYDVDNSGKITQEEMVRVLTSVAKYEKGAKGESLDPEVIKKFVAEVFEKYDQRKNNVLTYDEYMRAVMNHPDLVEYRSDITLLGTEESEASEAKKAFDQWVEQGVKAGFLKAEEKDGATIYSVIEPS
uniref:EF-hand domain-containing protein n=1 Tax=Lotharella oceanica TaxID=641309 RepID=A0A7S2TXC0_9EUKA|mmetsp:Transcript_34145/g.63297  ORF Transcript_34145/g.63297 Transcript_34145/m.63297 type:complete len:261 (+) Transcript_34145:44-826(+)